ncbi:hypothetical protein D3C72_1875030 [compost metagenome]
MGQCALRHGGGHFLADGAVFGDQFGGHAQHAALGAVGIGDETPFEPGARARDIGDGLRHAAARARFGRGQQQAFRLQGQAERGGEGDEFVAHG